MSSTKRRRSLSEVMAPIDDGAAPRGDAALSAKGSSVTAGTPRVSASAAQAVVAISILVAPEDRRRLRQLSLDTNLSLQKLGHEAWNLLLKQRGLPPLKAVSANVPSGRLVGSRPR